MSAEEKTPWSLKITTEEGKIRIFVGWYVTISWVVFWLLVAGVIIYFDDAPELPSQTIGEELSELEAKVDNLELERSALFGALKAHQEKNTLIQQDLDACQLAASRTTGTEQLP